ncbi:peptidoglycan-binding protein [Rhizobium sp. YIM 134829]|uniref:peptidoglycan-binding protein n=1 Tax=Rhizobium sp. YIM 134829 TaxID=3390453 RepID=UPI00397E34F4
MNGSRPTPPRQGFREASRTGDSASLEALNRTIEGLEARIEGLMPGAARDRAPRAPQPERSDRAISSRAEAISEILERQRALAATRLERAAERRPETLRTSAPRMVTSAYDDRRPTEPALAAPASRTVVPPLTPAMPDAAMREIADALVGLRQELKRDIEDGLTREMTALRAEIRGIKAEAAQDDRLAVDIRSDLQRLADSISTLGHQAPAAEQDALRAEFDDLRRMIDGLAREDSVRRMETRWTGVEEALSLSDSNRDDELVALAYRLDEIKQQLGTLNAGPALNALEDKLYAVAQAIDLMARNMQPDDRRFDGQFAELDQRLDEISRAIVASGRTAPTTDSPGVTRVEGRLADLSRQIDSLALPSESGLSSRIETLALRVEDLAQAQAAARLEERLDQLSMMMERAERAAHQPDLTDHLTDISRKIDALDQGSVNDVLAHRLDTLARRIEELDTPSVAQDEERERFARLEDQLTDIALRLQETQAAPYDDGAVLRSLQDQIANLSSLVSQPREPAPVVIAPEFEGRVSALEDYLASSDEYIIEAARQAAEAVMEAYSRNGIGQASAAAPADIAAISSLADDLKTLETLSRSSEERTARTFEALHETLVHIADKLERIEERHQEQMLFRPTAAPMPRAETPLFFNDRSAAEAETRPQPAAPTAATREAAPADTLRAEPDADLAGTDTLEDPFLDPVDDVFAAESAPAKPGLFSGFARRFSRRTAKAETALSSVSAPEPRVEMDAPLAAEVANQPLEPGSGVPDVKKILERVRAGQAARGPSLNDGDKSDFITAARRAAKLAAEEADSQTRLSPRAESGAKTSLFAAKRRPILMAVGAILLAILSYKTFVPMIVGDAPAPVAATEQSLDRPADAPAAESAAPADASTAATAPEETAADGSNEAAPVLAQPTETPASEDSTAAQPASEPAAPLAAAQAQPAVTEPVVEAAAPATPAAETKSVEAAPLAATQIEVPAEIKPQALADAARQGDALALFEIGTVYTEGRGVAPDLAKAAQWYQRAADAGLTPAEYRLASLYEKGSGVPRDAVKARALYEQAAAKGNASAMHNLAVLLASGTAVTAPDFAAAARWFEKAAVLGVRDSQFNLAILYARGNGVPQNLEASYKWFAVAAKEGDADAAAKSEEVAKTLSPEQLTRAKAAIEDFKATVPDAASNDVTVPDAWVGKAEKTSSVDMKRAVRNIQAILNNNGFDAGKPDGELGTKTVSAIKAFQTSIGQEATGKITDALVKELLKRNG